MKLSNPVAYILAIVAGAAEIIQQYAIPASSTTHSVISFALLVIVGLGVVPLSTSALRRLIPLHVAAALTAGAGVLQVLQQVNLNVSPTVHSIIALGLVLLAAVGIVPNPPTPAPVPASPERPPGR